MVIRLFTFSLLILVAGCEYIERILDDDDEQPEQDKLPLAPLVDPITDEECESLFSNNS